MAKLLYIKASPKSNDDSITFKMSEAFMDEYRKNNPSDEILTLDLYKENIRFLDGSDLVNMFSGNDFDVKDYAKQFASADKYVFAAPLWNLHFPAILKAYLDYVTYVGITFKYTETGAVGLLTDQGKKVVHFVARGGDYSNPTMLNFESGDKYLRIISAFMGLTDFTTISCELTSVLTGDALETAVNDSIGKAADLAKSF